MNPRDVQQIQNEIAIAWDDGAESYIPLDKLRRGCPCAACSGEQDIMGNQYKAKDLAYKPESFRLVRFDKVGGYAVQFTWGDGHNSGIYAYPYLKKLGVS